MCDVIAVVGTIVHNRLTSAKSMRPPLDLRTSQRLRGHDVGGDARHTSTPLETSSLGVRSSDTVLRAGSQAVQASVQADPVNSPFAIAETAPTHCNLRDIKHTHTHTRHSPSQVLTIHLTPTAAERCLHLACPSNFWAEQRDTRNRAAHSEFWPSSRRCLFPFTAIAFK